MFGKPPKNKKLVASHKNKDIEHLLIESERTKNNLASLVCSVNDLTRDLVEQLRTELNEKDTELTATAEISTDAIFLCNANGLVVRTNKRADQMLEAAGHKTKVIWDYIDVPRRDWQLFEQDPSVITFKTKTGRTIESTIDVTALDRMDGTRSYIVMVSISSHPWDDIHLSQSKGSLLVTNGIISASSNAAENSLKYGHEEMLGKRFIDLIDKEDRAFISKYIISMRREAILDCCIIAKDGSKLYCRIATSFFGPEDKFILTINNIGVDQAARQSNFVRFMGKDYEFNSIKYDSTEPEYFVFLTP
jgi:PAS domain-containing protein